MQRARWSAFVVGHHHHRVESVIGRGQGHWQQLPGVIAFVVAKWKIQNRYREVEFGI